MNVILYNLSIFFNAATFCL